MSYFLYSETAFHHEGDAQYLLSLVEASVKSGCHGIKFQVLIELNELMSIYHSNYQTAKKWVLSRKEWENIFQAAHAGGLKIIAMPLDVSAVDFLETVSIPIEYYDIHSISYNDLHFLESIRKTDKPIIFGVGGRTIHEITDAKVFFAEQLKILMVGFQSYPTDLKDVKLERIEILKKLFPECQIGYADHSSYDSEYAVKSLEYAYLLGARVFEKHITCNEGIPRIDHEAAIGIEKIVSIKRNLDYLDDLYQPSPDEAMVLSDQEQLYRKRQKILVASKPIKAGETITNNNSTLKMVDILDGYPSLKDIQGKVAKSDMLPDEPITSPKLNI